MQAQQIIEQLKLEAHPEGGYFRRSFTHPQTTGDGSAQRPLMSSIYYLLTADSATGARSTALVSQGKIAHMIAAKPAERRQMLEEAAGIAGLHVRRKDAESKLRSTENNLSRLEALLAGLDTQIASLRRQAKQAERYAKLTDEIGVAEARLVFARWRDAAASADAARKAAIEAERAVESAKERAGETETAQREAAEKLADARDALVASADGDGRFLLNQAETLYNAQIADPLDPAALGVQDYVIVTLKAHSVPPVVTRMTPLIGADTTIVSGVNGVPWWYFHKHGGAFEGTRLASVDPGDAQWNGFGPDRVLGCVVYPAAEVTRPGVITHIEGNRFSLGEPDGTKSDRALALSRALAAAGLKAPVRPRIRDEIWVKLWGNLSFNPISALTHATLEVLCTDPGTRAVARGMMREAQEIAEKLGVKFPIDVERRIDGGAAVGAHRTSMWQDLDAGRPMEIDALVGAVQELGRLTDTPTPTLDTVLALVALRGRVAGLYH